MEKKTIQDKIYEFDQLIFSQKSVDSATIQNICSFIESLLSDMDGEDDDDVKVGYYKYLYSDKCLTHIVPHLDEKKKKKHQKIKKKNENHYKQYQRRLQDEEKPKEINLERLKEKWLLIIGQTGAGKSHFVQNLTNDYTIEISPSNDSHTKECNIYQNQDGLKFIDTPGLNDTNINISNDAIFIKISKFLHENQIKCEDIFIIRLQSDNLQNTKSIIEQLAYFYFLYKEISQTEEELSKLMIEYNQSKGLLNWSECFFDHKQDNLSIKRNIISNKKDIALNIVQMFYSHHIVVKTFIDQQYHLLEQVDYYLIDCLREQIWSNIKDSYQRYYAYKDYISNQEQHLLAKLDRIIDLEDKNLNLEKGKHIVYILLIGKSQIGKSALIEQLTGLRGLRGTGIVSETQVCHLYSVEINNTTYKFIDTPGFNGTEVHQQDNHNLKIIADFLRRNEIMEFQILFLDQPNINPRDQSIKILKLLLTFIDSAFDRDISFINSQQLTNISFPVYKNGTDEAIQQMKNKDEQKFNFFMSFMKKRILKVNVQFTASNRQILLNLNDQNGRNAEDQNGFKTINFELNWYKQGYFLEVESEIHEEQKQLLFKCIDSNQSISKDEKILMKMRNINQIQIKTIENLEEYVNSFNSIKEKYLKLYNIQKIAEKNNILLQNLQDLQQELEFQIFVVVITDTKIIEKIKAFLKNKNNEYNNNNPQTYVASSFIKDILKHFIVFHHSPILYETNMNSKNIFISRKQHFYCLYSHLLRRFLKKENQDQQRRILEQLSRLRVFQEIIFKQYLQQKQIDEFKDQIFEEAMQWIEQLDSGLNMIELSGIQIYRHITYFSNTTQLAKFSRLVTGSKVLDVWVNGVLGALNIGIDIFSYFKGQIGGKQLTVSTSFNLSSLSVSLVFLLVPGIGLGMSAIAGGIGLIGIVLNYFKFTSSSTFDLTIRLFLKDIMEDTKQNQSLLYFQQSEMLKKQYNFSSYSQLQEQKGYDMFRKLEKDNLSDQNQEKILSKLFPSSGKELLKDSISHYIVDEYISNKFQDNLDIIENEQLIDYFKRLKNSIDHNKMLINTFYNRMDEYITSKILKNDERLSKIVQIKLSHPPNLEKINNEEIWNKEEKQVINCYTQSLATFIKCIRNKKRSYDQQKQLGDGFWRKDNHFPLVLNSYCNLIEQKTEKSFSQPIISDLEKDDVNKCFKIKDENAYLTFLNDDKESNLNKYLELLCKAESYIVSRYLIKLKNQPPNLSSISLSEIKESHEVEYFQDLHDFLDPEIDFQTFISKINLECIEFKIEGDNKHRLKNFYDSVKSLSTLFKTM